MNKLMFAVVVFLAQACCNTTSPQAADGSMIKDAGIEAAAVVDAAVVDAASAPAAVVVADAAPAVPVVAVKDAGPVIKDAGAPVKK